MSKIYKNQHPYLYEISKTITELSQNQYDEKSRQKLIALEKLLAEKLLAVKEIRLMMDANTAKQPHK